MKKAFSLVELVIVLLITSAIAVIALKAKFYTDERLAFNVTMEDIVGVLDYGVFSPQTGYMSGMGGDCSTGINVNNISVTRVVKCADLNSSFNITSSGDELDGENSYFTFMEKFSDSGKGCQFSFDEMSANEFYIFMDCDIKKNERVENYFATSIKKAFPESFMGVDFESISLSTNTGGTKEDGMVRVLIKK